MVEVSVAVDPRFELAGVMSMVEKTGRAYRFSSIRGSKFPLVGGLGNTLERLLAAIGREGIGAVDRADLHRHVMDAGSRPLDPIEIQTSPVTEILKQKDLVDLTELPVPTFFEQDTGPYITAAIGVTRDPDTNVLNVGIYRTLVVSRNSMVVNASAFSDLQRIYRMRQKMQQPMPIALAIGVPPAVLMAAVCKTDPSRSEYGIAGALMGRPLELIRCEHSDLMVPASSEFVLEGEVDFGRHIENNMGEFAGQYGPGRSPLCHVRAIRHRKDAVYQSILGGLNPEHNLLGSIASYGIRQRIAQLIKEAIPCVRGCHVFLSAQLGPMAHVAVSMEKSGDGDPRQVVEKIFALSSGKLALSSMVKRVIVVDEDVDIGSWSDVEWAIWTRAADETRFINLGHMKSWEMERGANADGESARLGVDATMALADVGKLVRPKIPGAVGLSMDKYLKK